MPKNIPDHGFDSAEALAPFSSQTPQVEAIAPLLNFDEATFNARGLFRSFRRIGNL
jgi:hypothetical protein